MSTFRIPLFKLLGFRINLDISLFILAALLMVNLGGGYFPAAVPGIDRTLAYALAALGALGLFASIIFHELAHAVVARRFKVGVGGITLFIFGGVAEMQEEAPTPKAEFWIAIAGPISSILLAAGFFALQALTAPAMGSEFGALVSYLAIINTILAVFNMVPAFPLDGGRILRAVLWWINGDLVKSTRIAATLGTLLGYGFVALGVYETVQGRFTGGLWYVLIGFFVIAAARQSRVYTEISSSLKGIPVARFMKSGGFAIPASANLQDAADAYFARHYLKSFPVVDDAGYVQGTLKMKSMLKVNKRLWPLTSAISVMEPLDKGKTLTADMDALNVLLLMQDTGAAELSVLSGGKLAGIVEQRDLINFHAVQMEFAGADKHKQAEGEKTA